MVGMSDGVDNEMNLHVHLDRTEGRSEGGSGGRVLSETIVPVSLLLRLRSLPPSAFESAERKSKIRAIAATARTRIAMSGVRTDARTEEMLRWAEALCASDADIDALLDEVSPTDNSKVTLEE
jgi:hypothetical protein